MPNVAYGDGSIIKRPDGRLQVVVSIDGKRVFRMVPKRLVLRDPKAARKRAEAIQRELIDARDAGLSPSSQTLAVWLRSWLRSHREAKRPRIRPRTLDGYESIAERSLIPALGAKRLDRLNEHDIQRWVDGHPGSPQTVLNHRALLRRVLNVAVRQRLITRNPATVVELPESEWTGGDPLTAAEAHRLFAATSADRLGALWRLAIDTGLRQGELLGLGWDDLDLDAGTVVVRAQLQRHEGQWVRTPTKAARTLHRLHLDSDTVASLRVHRQRAAAERLPDWQYWGLVFVKPNGEPYHGADVLRAFHAACDLAGISRRRFHDLRASTATVMNDVGVPEDARMARLGHSTTRMSRHYARSSETQDRAAADALGEAIRRAGGGTTPVADDGASRA